ncbi:MAG TPA: peptidyl-prolyl cis-trans isomerase [Thermoanaerobaculia bacterium]|nr:peptidyl-prolyl cis-trans isomerase [Thermoanaerobaculia bacterium]
MPKTFPSSTAGATAARAARAALLVCALLALGSGPALAETLNRIVIQVNDRITTFHEYQVALGDRQAGLERAQLPAEERSRVENRLPAEVLRSIFEEMLLLSRADQLSLRTSASEIEAMLDEIQQANNFTSRDELKQAVTASGQTWEAFREQLEKNQRIQEVIGREVSSRIKLEEDDLRIYYRDHSEQFTIPEERRLVEVVVLDSSSLDDGAKKALADELSRRMNAGEAPATLVAETAGRGETSGVIDLDWVPKGDLDPTLEAAIAGLKPGQASQPVSARGGLHVLQLVDLRPARLRGFDEVKEEISHRERSRRFEKEFPVYLKELEAKSYVVVNAPPGAENFRRTTPEPRPGEDPLDAFRKPKEKAAGKP